MKKVERIARAEAALASEPTGSKPEFGRSMCCNTPAFIDWSRMDDPEYCSNWVACTACGKPCETVSESPSGGESEAL